MAFRSSTDPLDHQLGLLFLGHAGLLYANQSTGNSAQLSLGRQTWTLNNGFLISMIAGAANGGERGATYLGPRHDTDFSGLFTGEFGRARFAFFFVDPDELEDLESNTTFAGANLGYRITDALSADVSLITIPTSDLSNRTPAGEMLKRAGTKTFGLHALNSPPATDHLWLEAEAYQQTSSSPAGRSATSTAASVSCCWALAAWCSRPCSARWSRGPTH